ncbi:unnamed protein product [Caenorhabditis angaria]|uniref:Cell division control protein 73 C-terminal domain-containing protein n=1 Tax=Caenorhabditis angaria TaxID=860376 RepID=A0A9P1IRA9_9PELO|nr:unnamed protein product [Caenorhabditis angaria]
MDPLEALQKYVAKEVKFQEVQYNNEIYYAFGDNAYLKNTLTGIPIYGKTDEYYTLEALLLFYQSLSLGHGVYVKEAASRDVRAITRIDRKSVQELLEGRRGDIPINTSLPTQPPISLRSILSSEPESKRAKLDEEALEEEQRRNAQAAQVEVRALNENLTVDRIAEMRRKRQLHQKKNIVATDESAPGGSSLSSSTKEIPKVREHRTRENVMLGSRDLSGVLDIIQAAQRQWEIEEKKEKVAAIHATTGHGNHPSSHSHQQNQQQQQQQQNRSGYSRYAQESFATEKSHEFQTDQSFIGSNLHALKQGNGGLKPVEPSPMRQSGSSNIMSKSPMNSGSGGKRPSRTPIIVVPGALTSLITIYNAKDILQDLTFVPSAKRKSETNKKLVDVIIQRVKNGQTYNIRVIDQVDKLTNEDYDRIIAVFAQGVSWQFKGWKWNGVPTDIFTHIPGFHLYSENDKPHGQASQWNVTRIPVAVTKRHTDRAKFSSMWEHIENSVRKTKPHLCQRLGL